MEASNKEFFDTVKLMRDLVAISSEKWVAESRFSRLAATYGAVSVQQRIVFFSELRSILKDLPMQVFADNDIRNATLDAAQEALDIATYDEDNE